MAALIIRLPVTPAGRALFREAIAQSGIMDRYPDGSTLATTDWDQLAAGEDADWASYQAFKERNGL